MSKSVEALVTHILGCITAT